MLRQWGCAGDLGAHMVGDSRLFAHSARNLLITTHNSSVEDVDTRGLLAMLVLEQLSRQQAVVRVVALVSLLPRTGFTHGLHRSMR